MSNEKIAEIKSRLELHVIENHEEINPNINDDIRFLLSELDRMQEERDSHAPEGRNYTNQQYVKLLFKYESAQQEIEKLEHENSILKKQAEAKIVFANHGDEEQRMDLYTRIEELEQDRDSWRRVSERLEREKQKLIKALRFYEDDKNWVSTQFAMSSAEADRGERAYEVLKELGVTE